MTRHAVILNASIGVALLALLALTGVAWALVSGPVGVVIGLGIAAAKAVLIAVILMELRESSGLTRLFAAAGLYWLAILVVLTLTDVLARA